jgi:putative acetyltransferase
MKVSLRKFENQDTPALLQLFHDTVHSINAKDYPIELLDAWAPERPDVKRWQSRFKASKTIVAELDGKIVGFGNLEDGGKTIGMLYVHKDHQKQGVASALLSKLETKIAKENIAVAKLESSLTARSFFEKKGYSVVRENRKMLNGKAFVNLIMEKDLSLKAEKPMKEKPTDAPKRFKWRDLFINKVFDLMIVIVGVSIAFQLNNLKLYSDAKALERFYLEGMHADLTADVENMERILVDLQKNKKAIQFIQLQLEAPEVTAPLDSIAKGMIEIIGFSTFDQHSSTFDMIVNGNGLTVITNPRTRTLASEFYGSYSGIRRFEQIYTEVIMRAFAFLHKSLDISKTSVVDPSILRTTEMNNFLILLDSQTQDGIDNYKESLEFAGRLNTLLENDLRK